MYKVREMTSMAWNILFCIIYMIMQGFKNLVFQYILLIKQHLRRAHLIIIYTRTITQVDGVYIRL